MTDSGNITDVLSPVPFDSITCVGGCGANLWIGLKDGSIVIASKCQGPEQDQFVVNYKFAPFKQNYVAHKMVSTEKPLGMIVHYTGMAGQPGPIVLIRSGGIRTVISLSASNMVCGPSKTPKISFISQSTLSVYQFEEEILIEVKSFKVPDGIKALAMSDESIIYFADSKYTEISINDGKISDCPQMPVEKPFAQSLNESSILVGYSEYEAIISAKSDKQPPTRSYPPGLSQPSFLFGDIENLYQFYTDSFVLSSLSRDINSQSQTFEIPGVRFCTKMANDTLLVTSSDTFHVIGSVPPPAQMAKMIVDGKAGEVDSILGSLTKGQAATEMISIFSILWRSYKCEEALRLAAKHVWIGDIREVITLFPSIIMRPTPVIRRAIPDKPSFKLVGSDLGPNELLFYTLFKDFIEFSYKHYRMEVDPRFARRMKPIVTSLAEVYALLSETRELADLLESSDDINYKDLEEFIDVIYPQTDRLKPAKAVLLTKKGQFSDAITIWREMNAKEPANKKWLMEAAYSLQRVSEDEAFVKFLDWLYSKNAESAMIAIMSKSHKIETAIGWLEAKKLTTLRYLCFILSQSGFPVPIQRVNETFFALIDILGKIDEQSFELKQIDWTDSFTECSKLSKDEMKAAAKIEIGNKVRNILECRFKDIDCEEALKRMAKKIDKGLIFCLLRLKERYDEAMKMMLPGGGDIPYKDIQEFCRASQRSEKAFSSFFKAIGGTPNKELLGFIRTNLTYVDPVEILKLMPKSSQIKEVSEIVRGVFCLLEQRRCSLDVQLGTANAVATDTRFDVSMVECKSCTIDEETKCARCGQLIGDGVFSLSTDNQIYHYNCK